jgi:predicted transposase/invertase (TIGR01784 family)
MKDEYSQEESVRKAKEEGLQLGEERGIEKGIEQGIGQGIEQGKLEIAKNMLAQGLAIELIEQVTGIHRDLFKS